VTEQTLTIPVAFNAGALQAIHDTTERQLAVFQGMVISTPDDARQATEYLQQVMRERDAADAMLKSVTKPLREAENRFRALVKPTLEGCDRLIALFKGAIGRYELAVAEQQRAAYRAAAEAAAAAQAAPTAEAAQQAQQVMTQQLSIATAAEPPKLAGASVREVWKAEVYDANAVPREYCCPDVKALAALAKMVPPGGTPPAVPGVRFIKDAQVAVRR